MTRIFWLLCLFLLNSLGFSQDQNPSFESLSQNTPSASVQKSVSLSQSFTQVSEQFLSLRNLFEALPLLLDPGAREVFPKASLSLKKEISQKALEISSTVAGIQDEDFKALKQSLLELGSDSVKLEDIPGILIELDSRLLNIGQKLFLNPAFPETTVLPRINLQAALLLLQNLKTQDFSSNQSGLKTLLHDLIQVLEIKNDPIYGVVQKILEDTTKVFDAKLLTPALSQITRIFESVLHQKDGRDPWHPPIPIPQDLSPTQKDQIIAHALNTSSRPGFFQRAQSTVTNFLIPAAHAQTQTQNLPNRDLGTARKRLVKLPNGSEYRGDLVGNLPHGRGWLKNSNGTSFVGDWVLGKPHGHGVLQLHKGNLYSGEIHNGIPQGTGSFTAPDGSVYQGAVLNGRPHGEGKIIFPNGIVIEAEFENGIPDGIALLRDGFGNTSEFSFVDGEPLGDARIFTQGLVLDGWLNGSFDAFEIMGVSDRFGNFLEVFQDDATESENDSEISSSTSEDLPSAPLYETSSQRISVARFAAYDSGFECSWNGEVSPFGQNQKLAPHGYGEISCADGFTYTGLAESYLHPTNGVISEAHGYGRVTLSSRIREAVTEIDGNFERGLVIGQARVLFDSGLVFEGRVDTTRLTLNPVINSYRSPAARDGFYTGSEDNPLGSNGVLYLGPVQNSYPHGYGFLKRYWYEARGEVSERCQYQFQPEGHRRAGYCEFKKPNNEEFKGYQYGSTYTINPDRSYPGALGRGADYKNGTRWREGWYADHGHYIGQELPANYSHNQSFVPKEFLNITQEESFTEELVQALKSLTWEEWVDLGSSFIPAGKFASAVVKLWETYRIIEELRQANTLASDDEIRARLLEALKHILLGKTLEKLGSGAFQYLKKLKDSKTRVDFIPPPANRRELIESKPPATLPAPTSPPIPQHVQDLLNSGDKNIQVYLGRNRTGKPVYVGISNNIPRRQKEHGDRFDITPIVPDRFTNMQARAIEEYFIEVGGYHYKKNPQMENKKHSVSLKNKNYGHIQKFAKDLLEQRGLLDELGIPKKIP